MTPESLLLAAIHSSPFWGLVIFLFKHYFKKIAESHRLSEVRLKKIEDKLDVLNFHFHEANPIEVKAKLEEVSQVQRKQAVEIEAQWEAIRDLRRLSLT